MKIKSVAYPIMLKVGGSIEEPAEYNIWMGVDGTPNLRYYYTGRSTQETIDISELLQGYFNSYHIKLPIPDAAEAEWMIEYYSGVGANPGVEALIISSMEEWDLFVAANDYDPDFVMEYEDPYLTSGALWGVVHPRQIVLVGMNHSPDINGNNVPIDIFLDDALAGVVEYAGYGILGSFRPLAEASTVRVDYKDDTSGELLLSQNYDVDPSAGDFAIYFVNKLGGIYSMLFKGKVRESYGSAETSIETNYDRADPTSFGTRVIEKKITKRYSLYTGILSDEQSRDMSDLFSSPKMWIHDLKNDRIRSCRITDTNLSEITYRNDGKTPYQITVEEAQKRIRR